MVYSGFCVKQNKDYFVEFTQISVSSLEDKSPKSINGRLKCKYAGFTGQRPEILLFFRSYYL